MLKKLKFKLLFWLLEDDAIVDHVTRKVIRGREVKRYIINDSSDISITDSILVDTQIIGNTNVELVGNTALGFIFSNNSARTMTHNLLKTKKED